MAKEHSRRRLLKLMSMSAVSTSGLGIVGVEAQPAAEDHPHELKNDLQVKDLRESPGEMSVQFLNNGRNLEFSRQFDFRAGNGARESPIWSVENVELTGNGRYVVQVRTSSDVRTEPIEIPAGGIQPSSTILVSRYPEELRVSVVLR